VIDFRTACKLVGVSAEDMEALLTVAPRSFPWPARVESVKCFPGDLQPVMVVEWSDEQRAALWLSILAPQSPNQSNRRKPPGRDPAVVLLVNKLEPLSHSEARFSDGAAARLHRSG